MAPVTILLRKSKHRVRRLGQTKPGHESQRYQNFTHDYETILTDLTQGYPR